MNRMLLIILFFSVKVAFTQDHESPNKSWNDSSLAVYLKSNFYSEEGIDSCYFAVQFLRMQLDKNDLHVSFPDDLKDEYKKRIQALLSDPSKFWDQRFISFCRKNKKTIIQPVLFDISANCYLDSSDLQGINGDTLQMEIKKE